MGCCKEVQRTVGVAMEVKWTMKMIQRMKRLYFPLRKGKCLILKGKCLILKGTCLILKGKYLILEGK